MSWRLGFAQVTYSMSRVRRISGVSRTVLRGLLRRIHQFHSSPIYDTYEIRPPSAAGFEPVGWGQGDGDFGQHAGQASDYVGEIFFGVDAKSCRGRSEERTIKAKPRPKFPVRKRGTK